MAARTARTIRRMAGLTGREWRYLGIAAKELLIARVRHATRPAGDIIEALQRAGRPAPGVAPDPADLARRSWAIAAVAARVPWRSDCLIQAMAADRWLRRDRLETEFFIGVATGADSGFGAHAWLRSGGCVVTGGDGRGFVPLVTPPAP